MYQIKKKGKTQNEHLIEKKYEHTITFTLEDIEAHERVLEKTLKEFKAQMDLETAKYQNISEHHKWVTKLTPEELHTANLFCKTVDMISALGPKIKEIKKQIKEYKVEKAQIKEALGFEDEKS